MTQSAHLSPDQMRVLIARLAVSHSRGAPMVIDSMTCALEYEPCRDGPPCDKIFSFALLICRRLAAWRNWQTRLIQNQVSVRTWRFESSRRYLGFEPYLWMTKWALSAQKVGITCNDWLRLPVKPGSLPANVQPPRTLSPRRLIWRKGACSICETQKRRMGEQNG